MNARRCVIVTQLPVAQFPMGKRFTNYCRFGVACSLNTSMDYSLYLKLSILLGVHSTCEGRLKFILIMLLQ